jgi:carboxymethylenebutenolidase
MWLLMAFVAYVLLTQIHYAGNAFAQETNASMISSNDSDPSNASGISTSSTGGDIIQENGKQSLENQTVNYYGNTSGYLVYPKSFDGSMIKSNNTESPTTTASSAASSSSSLAGNKLPAVVMIHENRGLNEHIKMMADTLAKEGYVVLAVDLFNGQVASNQEDAGQLSGAVRENPTEAIANLRAAVRYLCFLRECQRISNFLSRLVFRWSAVSATSVKHRTEISLIFDNNLLRQIGF